MGASISFTLPQRGGLRVSRHHDRSGVHGAAIPNSFHPESAGAFGSPPLAGAYHPAVSDWMPPPMDVAPVTLEGQIVRLEPLEGRHYPALLEVGLAPELWRWTVEWIDTPELLTQYLDLAQRARDDGTQLPFVTVEQATGKPVGSTRFLNIDRIHHRLEIGYTWVAPPWQRSGANLEAKLLQLQHAFDALACRRVEFKTDSLNEKSNAALLGIGARFEGIFRNHMISQGGRMRHSSYYSIIDTEWPEVRTRLEDHVAAHLAIRS
jgi:RimJ/RimL family protein N-acetyltransferase